MLNVDGSAITDASLIHLEGTPGLQALNLGATDFTDANLAPLKVLKDLRTLGVALTSQKMRKWIENHGL